MSTWIVSADLLARSRFVISPFAETVAALTVLSRPDPPGIPWQRPFRARHRDAYLEMLGADETRRAVADYLWRPRRGPVEGWMADFLGLPPAGPDATFDEEIEQILMWDDDRIRAEIRECAGRPLPEPLTRSGPRDTVLRDAVADILRWVWTATLVSEWPHRRRVLEADIVSRTSRLATRGWAGVFGTLGKHMRWLDDGHLQINGYELPSRDLSGARELSFVPVHADGSWAAWTLPDRFALIYPVAGALADVGPARPDGLARLIGANRARVLKLLDEPHSTTQIAALTGLPMGSVGNHLRVLLDSGAVLRRRADREVLYWRTSLGDSLAVELGPLLSPPPFGPLARPRHSDRCGRANEPIPDGAGHATYRAGGHAGRRGRRRHRAAGATGRNRFSRSRSRRARYPRTAYSPERSGAPLGAAHRLLLLLDRQRFQDVMSCRYFCTTT